MKIQPVILTTPAYREKWAEKLAASFRFSASVNRPLIYCDEKYEGSARASQKAIQLAMESHSHVLFLEDDVIADETAVATLGEVTFPESVGVISFCDMREISEYSPDGVYVRSALGNDGWGWWGNQALLIHHDTAAMLAREDWFSDFVNGAKGVRANRLVCEDEAKNLSDQRLSILVDSMGKSRNKFAVHVPSLFQHAGQESRCYPGRSLGERETRNWIGYRRQTGRTAALSPSPTDTKLDAASEGAVRLGPDGNSMKIQPVILTTPALREKWAEKLAASLGYSPSVNPPLIYCDDEYEGAARASQKAIQLAMGSNSHVLFLEDNFIADETAVATIAGVTFPDSVGVISFCDMRVAPEYSPDGIYICSDFGNNGWGWWGSEALLIHHDTAAMLVREDWFSDFVNKAKAVRARHILQEDEPAGKDLIYERVGLLIDHMGNSRDKFAVHVPSLFQHAGQESQSQCFPGRSLGERETRNWIGNRRRVGLTATDPHPDGYEG